MSTILAIATVSAGTLTAAGVLAQFVILARVGKRSVRG